MEIVLLRHTESESNKANSADSQIDAGLTEEGQRHAQELVFNLAEYNFDLFIISPLKRTLQTIEPLLKNLQNPIIVSSELTLERNLGNFIGTPMGSFQNYCKENNINLVTCKPENGESILETYERAKIFLNWLKENYLGKSILVCGHKNFLLCLEIAVNGNNIKDYYFFKALGNGEFRRFIIEDSFI